jgi:SAM-dependent methyltransferase
MSDVPSPIDLRQVRDALEWERTANLKRPWRSEFFSRFAYEITQTEPPVRKVLELGSGPGFLAEHLLRSNSAIELTLLDFSPAMHQLSTRARFLERNFKADDWPTGLGRFDCVVTNQAVHELRHKRHAASLHARVRTILSPGGPYLVCDHFVGEGGMSDERLYMSVDEQRDALLEAGFTLVRQSLIKGGLALHRAT